MTNTPGRTAEEIAKEIVEHPDFPRYEYEDIEIIAAALREYAKAEVAKVKADSEIIAKAHNDIVRNWEEAIAEVRSKALTQAAYKAEELNGTIPGWKMRHAILALQSSPAKEETGEGA